MRIAVIERDLCKPKKCSLECQKVCPINRAGEKCCWVEDKARIDEALCVGCGLCVKKCPFKAISVVNTPEQLKETPVHRYENNGFALFRLPFPVYGKVTGIVGANGTGKSSAMKILSGELKPNFAGKETDLVKAFRGSEIQNYLERLVATKIKAVRKPQNVEEFSKYDVTVKEILLKADERHKYEKIIHALNLKNILDRKLSTLSGGELQRVIIAISIIQDADVYFFDEPTSFLDVSQRFAAAKAIRSLANEDNGKHAVLVVDHDLAVLDMVADFVHVTFGAPSVYGIFSRPYTARVGINNYIEGFLKNENIRFRAEPLKFHAARAEKKEKEIYLSWSDLSKSYPGFSLTISEGCLYKKQVIGILGENGTGKTTFAKMLAGIEKPDSGSISCPKTISYKSQYLSQDEDITVAEVLKKVTNINSDTWKIDIAAPLELERLYEKNIRELSGGELQRVAVAACLSRAVDVYLLDEPSAFLDVEERIALAKLLRKFADTKDCAILVIDHDLLFLSYLADSCILFSGTPSISAHAELYRLEEGFNKFLSNLGVTFRRDEDTGRPRANKPDSQLDIEQKKSGKFWMNL
jgi:ATP-binding cassette subfamily E protein 1